MPLTATHAPLLTLHMLWVDLSKCFMTFSRAVGQLLQARRGVPAQVRKAVWNLYSRPHGSFDSAFGCCVDFGSLRGSRQRSYPHPPLAFACSRSSHLHAQVAFTYFIFQCKRHPNDTWRPWYSRTGLVAEFTIHVRRHITLSGAIACQGTVAASHAARCWLR